MKLMNTKKISRSIILIVVIFAQAQLLAQKKMTVGDLLKKVSDDNRGGNLQGMQKSDTAVPESQFNFKQQEKTNFQAIKPPKSTEIIKIDSGSDQAQYEKTLDKQIQELFKLTKKFENSPDRGELWLRLAELYVEKATLVDFRKQDAYDQKLEAYQAGKTKVKPVLDRREATQYNLKAIQLYEMFLRDYPKDKKISQALFFLGYNYFELGKTEVGSRYYERLTKEYPKSPFVGEASFALGEYYFDNENWTEAYKHYTKLIRNKNHRLHAFSLYKGAWCLFRLGKTEDAIKYLDFIIRLSRDEQKSGVTKKAVSLSKLENEAIRDIVVFYADIEDVPRSINYFKNIKGNEASPYLEKLANYYGDKGNKEASREVFEELIRSNPTSKKAFDYQYQIVQNYFYARNASLFKKELYKWVNDYKKDSDWANANKNDQTFLDNAYKLKEQTLRNYIIQQHQTAQNSHAEYSRQSAYEGYQLYFQEFSDSPNVADMHFLFAELLYDMKRYEDAATNYTWVAENAPKSKYGAKAEQNLLLAIEKALPKDEELRKRVGDSVEVIPYDPRVEKFLKSAQWYVEKFPKSEKIAEIKFRMGRLNYQTNHFDEAEKIFKDIVKNHPKTKFSEYSANLLLDIYNIKKDFVGLEKVGTELLTDSSIANSKAGQDIRTVLERASFKKAQDLEVDKKYSESADQFQLFAQQNPKSELLSMALFNAGVNFERSNRNYNAIQSYQMALKSNDKNSDTIKPKAKKLLAKLYQDAGQFEDSARLFKELARENPNDKLADNYIYNAAIMYEVLGQYKDAVSMYEEFLKRNKSYKENLDAMFSLATIYRKTNQLTLAYYKYKEYTISAPDTTKKVEAYYWDYDIGRRVNKHVWYDTAQKELIQTYNKLNRANKKEVAHYVAKIKLAELKVVEAEMRNIKLPQNPAKQKEAIDKKLEVFNRLSTQVTEVIKLDSAEEIIASLYILGDANEHIARTFLDAPVPKELNEDQRKTYMAGIEKLADPFMKKAEEGYKATIERARDLDVYSEDYVKALEKMNARDPKNYILDKQLVNDTKNVQWIGDKK